MIATALLLVAAAAPATGPTVGNDPTHLLFFELKLLIRGRSWTRRVALDQWAGAELLLRESADGRLELVRPAVDPWTFRWYPTKRELKLGAALAVAEPAGDPYAGLEARLLPLARRLHETWWENDRVDDRGNGLPGWSGRVDGFWRGVHRGAGEAREPLAAAPTYPFHVLGEVAGRFALLRAPSGAVAGVRETMTSPWLADGWSRAVAGESVVGYGYWGTLRPWWEPRTYETVAAALELLRWPAQPAIAPAADPEWGEALGRVLSTLLPRHAGRFRWRLAGTWEAARIENGRLVRRASPAPVRGADGVTVESWRSTEPGAAGAPPRADELQLLAVHENPSRFKLWIRIGYAPVAR